MSEDVFVTVIVPVYNCEPYIFETLRSIESQTFKNIELIIIDDGSVDNSLSIIKKFVQQSLIKPIVISNANQGLSKSRNLGIDIAKGDYIAFIDADDIINPNHINNLVNQLTNFSLDAAFSSFEYTFEKNRFGCHDSDKLFEISINTPLFINNINISKLNLHISSGLYVVKTLKDNNIYFNEYVEFGEDRLFLFDLLINQLRISYQPIKSYKYLIRNNSIMSSINIQRIDKFLIEISKKYTETFKLINKPYLIEFKVFILKIILGLSRSIIRNSHLEEYIKFIKSDSLSGLIMKLNLIELRSNYYKIHLFITLKLTRIYFYLVKKILLVVDEKRRRSC